jgi:adenylate cyclase
LASFAVRYRFEDYILDTDRHELRRNGMIVPTASLVVDLLAYLIAHRGRIVTKDQLVAAVWEGRPIGDSAVTTRLNVLRSAIGDSGLEQRLIKTLPRKGFRFIGEVQEERVPALRHQTLSRDLPSIAVLPFANLSGDPAQDFFGDAIAEEVLTELARSRWLLVIARNSSFMFKGTAFDVREIGRQLDVRYLLEGSARCANGHVRVACRLVETQSALQVWSSRYHLDFSDVFQLQDQVRDAILRELAPAILDAERKRVARRPPETLTAWESYQRGVAQMLKQSVEENVSARQSFQQAIILEPDYSPGYDGLAWTHLVEATAFGRISIEEGCKRSEPLAHKALELDPENTGACARLALTLHLRGDNRAALDEAERALSISPNCADACGVRGTALLFSGEYTVGRASLERFLRLSPRDPARPIRLSQIAASFYFGKDYENAERVARQTVREHPTVPMAYRWLAASLGQLGRFAEGARIVDTLRHKHASSLAMYVSRPPYFRPDDHQHMMEGLAKAGWGR